MIAVEVKLSKILSMIAIEVVVTYGSLPDTAEMIIPSQVFSMIAIEL